MKYFLYILLFVAMFSSCSTQQKIATSAEKNILNLPGLKNTHIGISIYDVENQKYLYNHNAEKYFIPASNTKIAIAYVGMKYLGDSIPGLKVREYDDKIIVTPTGDPTLLDPRFSKQPTFEYLQKAVKPIFAAKDDIKTSVRGWGWGWDYMPERSSLPIYSNMVWFYGKKDGKLNYFPKGAIAAENFKINAGGSGDYLHDVSRQLTSNTFNMWFGGNSQKEVRIPFITSLKLQWQLLADTLQKDITLTDHLPKTENTFTIFTQPTDSILSTMMHVSDNLFAEQILLMASNAVVGEMTDRRFIEHILNSDFKNLPQKPNWSDGSGLSFYNQFTPQDFVAILFKMKSEFGMERIKAVFPTGNEGTLTSFYTQEKGKIFAKTGSLAGVAALSGFLYTKKDRLLIFSVLINNKNSSLWEARRAVEKFLNSVRNDY